MQESQSAFNRWLANRQYQATLAKSRPHPVLRSLPAAATDPAPVKYPQRPEPAQFEFKDVIEGFKAVGDVIKSLKD